MPNLENLFSRVSRTGIRNSNVVLTEHDAVVILETLRFVGHTPLTASEDGGTRALVCNCNVEFHSMKQSLVLSRWSCALGSNGYRFEFKKIVVELFFVYSLIQQSSWDPAVCT